MIWGLLIFGYLIFTAYGLWYIYKALLCKYKVNATLMKKERICHRNSYSYRLHFHVKGKQPQKYIIDNVFSGTGYRMEKHKKYNIYVSKNGRIALLHRWTSLLLGLAIITLDLIALYIISL